MSLKPLLILLMPEKVGSNVFEILMLGMFWDRDTIIPSPTIQVMMPGNLFEQKHIIGGRYIFAGGPASPAARNVHVCIGRDEDTANSVFEPRNPMVKCISAFST